MYKFKTVRKAVVVWYNEHESYHPILIETMALLHNQSQTSLPTSLPHNFTR
jgi:hypothetical protein